MENGIFSYALLTLLCYCYSLPLVDPGLFVISGVESCGNGKGYCLLGLDCTLDQDFRPDIGHCDGLKNAFTPSAHFVCCKDSNQSSSISPSSPYRTHLTQSTPNPIENEVDQELLAKIQDASAAFSQIIDKAEPREGILLEKIPIASDTSQSSQSEIGDKYSENKSTSEEIEVDTSEMTSQEIESELVTTAEPKYHEVLLISSESSAKPEISTSEEGPFVLKQLLKTSDETVSNESNTSQTELFSVKPGNIIDASSGTEYIIESSSEEGNLMELFNKENDIDASINERSNSKSSETSNSNEIIYTSFENDDKLTTETTVELSTLKLNSTVILNKCNQEQECNSIVTFRHNGHHLCIGTIFREDTWIITSASCAMRVFRAGMVDVFVSLLDNSVTESKIRTIWVHENYNPSYDNMLMPESYNIGMILLKNSLPVSENCIPCLPDLTMQFSGKKCVTLTKTINVNIFGKSEAVNGVMCKTEVETMQGEGNLEFFTMACNTPWEARYYENENDMGNPMMCDGYLAGIETTSGIGMMVFTPLANFTNWMNENFHRIPDQIFRTYL